MRVKYDLETDTLSIRLKDKPVTESECIEGKGIVIDYNEKMKLPVMK